MREIKKELNNLKLDRLPEIICEPGRAIVAESGSIVKVILKRKIIFTLMMELMDRLMLVHQTLCFHQKQITEGRVQSKNPTAFSFLDQLVMV